MRSRWSFDQQGINRHHFGDATSLLDDLITPAILRARPKKDRKKRTRICLTSQVVSTLKVLASAVLVTAVQTAVQICQVLIPGPVEISAMPLNTVVQCLSQEMTVPDTKNHGGTSPIFCTRGKDVGHQFYLMVREMTESKVLRILDTTCGYKVNDITTSIA